MIITRFKIYYFFILLCCLVHFPAISQEFDVELGPELKLAKTVTFQDHLYSDATGHYVYLYDQVSLVGRYGTTMVLEKYSPSFEKIFSKEFKMSTKGEEALGVKYVKGKFAFLTSETNKKEDYKEYWMAPIDFAGNQGERVSLGKFQFAGKKDFHSTFWKISDDTTRLAFAAIWNLGWKEQVELFLSVVDPGLNKIWNGKFKLPLLVKQFKLNSIVVGNDGSVYILAKVYKKDHFNESESAGNFKKVPTYSLKIFHFNKDSDGARTYEVGFDGKYINGAGIKLNNQEEIICAGLYKEDPAGPVLGTLLTKLSATDGEILSNNKTVIGKEQLELLNDWDVAKLYGKSGLNNDFKFLDLLLKEDGSISIIAEEQYSKVGNKLMSPKSENYIFPGKTSATNTEINAPYNSIFFNLDIISIDLNKNGAIHDLTVIPKNQAMVEPLYSSIISMQMEGQVYFFYNEDKDNLKLPVNRRPIQTTTYKGTVAVVTIKHKDESLSKEKIFDSEDTGALFVPRFSKQISKNELFFAAQRFRPLGQSEYQIGVISLKK